MVSAVTRLFFIGVPVPMQARTILMSIHSRFTEAIYDGTKLHEFRRVRTSFSSGDRVLIYEPLPTGLITGEFIVGIVLSGSPADLIRMEADPWSRSAAEKYLQGACVASAVEILQAVKWDKGTEINEMLPGTRPPQSYVFIKGSREREWDSLP